MAHHNILTPQLGHVIRTHNHARPPSVRTIPPMTNARNTSDRDDVNAPVSGPNVRTEPRIMTKKPMAKGRSCLVRRKNISSDMKRSTILRTDAITRRRLLRQPLLLLPMQHLRLRPPPPTLPDEPTTVQLLGPTKLQQESALDNLLYP